MADQCLDIVDCDTPNTVLRERRSNVPSGSKDKFHKSMSENTQAFNSIKKNHRFFAFQENDESVIKMTFGKKVNSSLQHFHVANDEKETPNIKAKAKSNVSVNKLKAAQSRNNDDDNQGTNRQTNETYATCERSKDKQKQLFNPTFVESLIDENTDLKANIKRLEEALNQKDLEVQALIGTDIMFAC